VKNGYRGEHRTRHDRVTSHHRRRTLEAYARAADPTGREPTIDLIEDYYRAFPEDAQGRLDRPAVYPEGLIVDAGIVSGCIVGVGVLLALSALGMI